MLLSKYEKMYLLTDIKFIGIIRRGIIKRGEDKSKFYIKLTFKNKDFKLLGDTYDVLTIQEKYKYIIAAVDGKIIKKNMPSNLIKEEIQIIY